MNSSSNLFRGLLVCVLVTAFAAVTCAQIRTPRLSPHATVSQSIGVTDISVSFGRPSVKGRKVFGCQTTDVLPIGERRYPCLVPYGQVWRTGADEASTFSVSDDVTVEGQKLAAGTYSLHTLPGENEWVVIFNKVSDQWGSFSYDEKQDALRVKAKPLPSDMQEWLTCEFTDLAGSTVALRIHFEKIAVRVVIDTGDPVGKTIEHARRFVAAAKPDDWRTPYSAANYAFQNKLAADDLAKWLDQSLKVKETPGNLFLKARVLAQAGKTEEAIATAEKAIQAGKAADAKFNSAPIDKAIAEWKAPKP